MTSNEEIRMIDVKRISDYEDEHNNLKMGPLQTLIKDYTFFSSIFLIMNS